MENNEKIFISDSDIKALIFMYGSIKFHLKHSKGLKLKNALMFEKQLEQLKLEIKNKNINLNDLYEFERGSEI